MEHDRKPISFANAFPVGKVIKVYHRDGFAKEMGLWDAEVIALDLDNLTITLNISQNWKGADTRGGQYWGERIVLDLDTLVIPLIPGGE